MGRGWRLQMVAGLGIALTLPALAFSAETSQSVATVTTLAAATQDLNGRTQATLTVAVAGKDGSAATGAVVIEDGGKPLAGAALGSDGSATSVLTLTPGSHDLTAVYDGDTTHLTSASQSSVVSAATSSTPDFSISASPTTLSLVQGKSGTVTVSITPLNASSLTAPLFVTLSCSGLPDESTCTFTPTSVEILPNATAAVTSSMVLTTVASNSTSQLVRHSSGIVWALLLPGAFGLAGIAFGGRRRAWLLRLSLLGLLAVITTLGTTGCNPLYNYKNHGSGANSATPAGTYTVKITGQSSDGVTATTHSTTMAFTVTE